MNEFYTVIGQIFIISMVQMILDAIFDGKYPNQSKIINLACYLCSLYIVVFFIGNTLFVEINELVGNIF